VLLREAESLRRSFFRAAAAASSGLGVQDWAPPVNVFETEEGLWLLLAIPGAAPEDVKVELKEGTLAITGWRSLPGKEAEGRLEVLEIPGGSFERDVRLPFGRRFEIGIIRMSEGILKVFLRRIA